MSKKEFIPEIFVYCDRWCERCPFTARCEIFDPAEQEKDWLTVDTNEFIKEVTATFEKTMNLLKNEADANGINWNQLVADAKEVELESPILPADHKEVVDLAGGYRQKVTTWLTQRSSLIEATTVKHLQNFEMGIQQAERNNSRFLEALEVINWYHALIDAKVRRAISGLHSALEQEDPNQSHENGCAKITVLLIEKSIQAWEQINTEMPEQEDEILDYLAALSKLNNKFRKIFPAYKAFIRPGFDTFII